MGRGRQKAKHTKVARDLKYFSPDTNYGALARELNTSGEYPDSRMHESAEERPEFADSSNTESDDDDLYVDRYATDDEDDEDESRTA